MATKQRISLKKISTGEYETFDGHFVIRRQYDEGQGVTWWLYFREADGSLTEVGDPRHETKADCTYTIVDVRNTESYKKWIAEKSDSSNKELGVKVTQYRQGPKDLSSQFKLGGR